MKIDWDDFAGTEVKVHTIDDKDVVGLLWMVIYEDETEENVAYICVSDIQIYRNEIENIEHYGDPKFGPPSPN